MKSPSCLSLNIQANFWMAYFLAESTLIVPQRSMTSFAVILSIGRPSTADASDGKPPAPAQQPPLEKQAKAVVGVALSVQAC